MLRPGNADQDPKAVGLGAVQKPTWRDGEGSDRIGAEIADQREIALDDVALGELLAV